MSRNAVLTYLSIPLILAIWGVAVALTREPMSLDSSGVGLLNFLFFAAPHLVWWLIITVAHIKRPVAHSGFVAASVALICISLMPLFSRGDPSGLPYHWLLYWPVAAVLQAALAGSMAIYVRVRSKSAV
jgi:hypothetical protein